MKTITEAIINKALATQPTPELAAYQILVEGEGVGDKPALRWKSGQKVAVLHDPIYALEGLQVEVVGPSDKGEQYVDVRTSSGMVVPIMSNLLAPAGGPSL
jgi:hypothetical protein